MYNSRWPVIADIRHKIESVQLAAKRDRERDSEEYRQTLTQSDKVHRASISAVENQVNGLRQAFSMLTETFANELEKLRSEFRSQLDDQCQRFDAFRASTEDRERHLVECCESMEAEVAVLKEQLAGVRGEVAEETRQRSAQFEMSARAHDAHRQVQVELRQELVDLRRGVDAQANALVVQASALCDSDGAHKAALEEHTERHAKRMQEHSAGIDERLSELAELARHSTAHTDAQVVGLGDSLHESFASGLASQGARFEAQLTHSIAKQQQQIEASRQRHIHMHMHMPWPRH